MSLRTLNGLAKVGAAMIFIVSFSEAEKSGVSSPQDRRQGQLRLFQPDILLGKDHSGQFALWDFEGWISEPWLFLIDKWSSNMNYTHGTKLARTIHEIPRTTCKSGEISGTVPRSKSHGCCLESTINYSEARRLPACRVQ